MSYSTPAVRLRESRSPHQVAPKPERYTARDVKRLESATRIPLTPDLKFFFQHPAASRLSLFVEIPKDQIYEVSFNSPSSCLNYWKSPYDLNMYREWTEFYREGGMDDKRDRRIHATYLRHRFWLPLASDGGGSDLLFDADPTHLGQYGQILFYRHDPDEIFYVAASFAEFIKKSRVLLEKHGKKLFA